MTQHDVKCNLGIIKIQNLHLDIVKLCCFVFQYFHKDTGREIWMEMIFSAVEYISRRLDGEAQARCGLNITSSLINTDFQEKRSIIKRHFWLYKKVPNHDLEEKEKRTEASPPRLPSCWYWYSFSPLRRRSQTAEVYRLGWAGEDGVVILLIC